jgi:PAS domain S-box-containing protein
MSKGGEVSKLLAYGIDITDRKIVELSLNESVARIEAILNNAVEAFITIDGEGIIDSFNPMAEKIFGYSAEEIIGKNVNLLMPSPHHEDHNKYIQNYLTTGNSKIIGIGREVIGINKAGKGIPLELSVSEVNIKGKTLFTGIIRDITERKLAEDALIKSEEKYRSIFESISDVYAEIDIKTGIITEISPSIEIISGYKREEMLNKDFSDFAEDSGFVSELIKKAIKHDKVIDFETSLKHKSGKILQCSVSAKLARDSNGKFVKLLGTLRDISERKESEHKLMKSEHQLSAVLSTVGEGIITIDAESTIVMANEEVERIWGYTREELIGSKITLLMPERFRESHFNGMQRYLETHVPKVLDKKLELEGERKDGSLFPLEITIKETVVDNEMYFTAAVHDISERKSMIQKLKQSNDALTEFAYIASHDLREPLRKISSFGSILEETLRDKIDEDDKENLAYMIDGAKRMQQMTDDLLSYSRLTSQVVTFQDIDLDDLVSDLINFELAAIIDETEAEVIRENRLGIVRGEQTQINQLFQNLINNGIKYNKPGNKPVVRLRSQKFKNMLQIEIEDNGIGIDSNYHHQIFEMFKRLHSRSEYSGSGIGLAICKKIVDIHEGEIGVHSQIDKGSVFWVKLLNAETDTIVTD